MIKQVLKKNADVIFLLLLLLISGLTCLSAQTLKTAIFAGGCFWCMEEAFDKVDGVTMTTSGYSGGLIKSPTYEMVSKGKTNHLEVILITYNPSVIDYGGLVKEFWKNIDPLDDGGQFCDRGDHYRSAIFFSDGTEEKVASRSIKVLEKKYTVENPISTLLLPRRIFYAAEDYHQDYYKKNPYRYKYYKYRCGRVERLKELGINKFTAD